MQNKTIKFLIASMLALFIVGCNGGGGSSGGVTTEANSSATSEESINMVEAPLTENSNNEPLVGELLNLSEIARDTGVLSSDVYINPTNTVTPAPVPEPATLALLGMGTGLLAIRLFRKKI